MPERTAHYVLELFIADDVPKAQAVAQAVRDALEAVAPGRHQLTIVNVLDHPERAIAAKVFATPMLIRLEPPPATRVLGDLSDPAKVLKLLGIEPEAR